MRSIFIILILALNGCAYQGYVGRADIMDGEVFISRNGVHTFSLDSDELYQFNLKIGSDMRLYNKTEQNIRARELRMREFRMLRESNQSQGFRKY